MRFGIVGSEVIGHDGALPIIRYEKKRGEQWL
jgi:hypothetical protein